MQNVGWDMLLVLRLSVRIFFRRVSCDQSEIKKKVYFLVFVLSKCIFWAQMDLWEGEVLAVIFLSEGRRGYSLIRAPLCSKGVVLAYCLFQLTPLICQFYGQPVGPLAVHLMLVGFHVTVTVGRGLSLQRL